MAATEPVDPRLAALRSSSPPGSRLGSPGRSGAAPRGCPGGRGWAGRGRVPRSPDSSLWHPVPRSHAGRALTLPLGARLPARWTRRCSTACWRPTAAWRWPKSCSWTAGGCPRTPRVGGGERRGRRGLLPRRAECAPGPALRAPGAPGYPPEPLSSVSWLQVPTPTATRPWTRSGRAGPGARPEPWWRGRVLSTSTASSTTRPVSAPHPPPQALRPTPGRDRGLGSGDGSGPSVGDLLRAAAASHRWR